MNSTRPYTFDRVVRMLIGLTVIVLLFLLTKRLSAVLFPFLLAWLIAYMLHPIVSFFQFKLKFKSRILSILSTFVLLGGVLTGLYMLVVPIVSSEVFRMSQLVSMYVQGVNVDSILPVTWQNEIRDYLSQFDLQTLFSDPTLRSVVDRVAPQLWNIVNNSISLLLGLAVVLMIFLYTIFILLDYQKVTEGWYDIIPSKFRPLIVGIMEDIEDGMNKYFRGQSLVALIVGVLFSIGFNIVGLPMAILFGLFVGLLNLVPYLQTIALVPGVFLALMKSIESGSNFGTELLWLFVVFAIVQTVQDTVLVPKIMGKVTGLKPAVILLSLSVWGSLMGMVGLIIALPLTTLIISYYKRFVLNEEGLPVANEKVDEEVNNATEVEV
ncbi:MAG: AI-2E family transporter [Paludibacteraceae bacterium]|nr:AI-2E family transporter [Paludibacteraceae bacterium]